MTPLSKLSSWNKHISNVENIDGEYIYISAPISPYISYPYIPPLPSKSEIERLKNSKNLTKKYKFIQVNYYENIIKSNKTINLIKYLNKKYNNSKLYLIMGADNLIHFHKWSKWRNISSRCDIIVFDRYPYKSKALKSLAFKQIDRQKLKFINFKKVNISSSQLRKI